MPEPKIDPHLHKDRQIAIRPFLVGGVPLFVLLLALLLTCFKKCTALGEAGRATLYDPTATLSADEGFVGKSNQLLSDLLLQVSSETQGTCLDSLNKRYKALEFALPYGEEHKAYIEASDLRLVAIHPEYIEDAKMREFYYNSRLPQLLQRQSDQLSETYFRFTCHADQKRVDGIRPLEVTSIKVIPSMFKVALSKNPWSGSILGTSNCLFSDSSTIYMTYGSTVLPLRDERRLNRENPADFQAIMQEGILLYGHQKIDYYDYYKKVFDTPETRAIRISMHDRRDSPDAAGFTISYSHGSLIIAHNAPITVIGGGKTRQYEAQTTGEKLSETIAFHDGMKVLVYDADSRKLGEFVFQRDDPSRVLSCLVQSSKGASRFTISPTQTDLFTQQLLSGLSRHLSNRDNVARVELTVDPLLSREFETEIQRYLKELRKEINNDPKKPKSQKKEQYDMSVTIMDLHTGEVLATPFYTDLFDHADYPEALRMTIRNPSLSRRSIGSTFKPMVALAAVEASPTLLNMNTASPARYHADFKAKPATAQFFGRRTHPWAEKTGYHWGGCDFTTFLSRSDDVYPVALAALAMTGERIDGATVTRLPLSGSQNFFEIGRDSLLKFKESSKDGSIDLLSHPFTNWLSYLYNTNYEKEYTTDLNLFSQLFAGSDLDTDEKNFGLEEISPELTSLRLDRFLDGDDFKQRLVPWVLGQGDNMWNTIKVAEAWCRMIGKYDVSATFIKPRTTAFHSLIQEGPEYPASVSGQRSSAQNNTTWNDFLDRLQAAQSRGSLLAPMHTKVSQLSTPGHTLTLFSKTGTPDAYSRYEFPLLGGNNRYVDVGMYAFGLVDQSSLTNIRSNRQGKGIVCVVRITRSYECQACRPGHQCEGCKNFWGIKSAHAHSFFSGGSNRLQKLYDMTRNYY